MQLRHFQYFVFFLFLAGTFLTGLTLRWQLTGSSWDWTQLLDWRRSHSHLGFYGLLFSMIWIALRGQIRWLPDFKIWLAYSALAGLSGIFFLIQGYGIFSIAASTGVLAIWLLFAWKNRQHFHYKNRDWLSSVPTSLLVSAFFVGSITYFTRKDPALTQVLVRTFLTLLLFGVFLPSLLKSSCVKAPQPVLWNISVLATSVFMTDLWSSRILGLGALFIAWFLAKFALDIWKRDLRLSILWALFAAGLFLRGLKAMDYSYFEGLAGVHFFVLGPLLLTFFKMNMKWPFPEITRIVYELSLAAMITGIYLMNLGYSQIPKAVAVSSSIFVANLLIWIAYLYPALKRSSSVASRDGS